MCVCPRPETFSEAPADWLNTGMVGMGLKKVLKMVSINRCDDLEEIRIFSDSFYCFRIGKLSLQYCQQQLCLLRSISKTWGWGWIAEVDLLTALQVVLEVLWVHTISHINSVEHSCPVCVMTVYTWGRHVSICRPWLYCGNLQCCWIVCMLWKNDLWVAPQQ